MSKDFPSLDLFRRRILSILPDAKGTIIIHDGSIVRKLAVGADGALPFADSAEAMGIKWERLEARGLTFDDNVKLRFGDDGDLEIFHDGTDNFIKSIATIIKIESGAVDAAGVTCLDIDTTDTITSGGAADDDLRELLRVSNNGTEAFQVYASGVAYAAGGLWAGKRRPTDSRYPASISRFEYDSEDGEHHNLLFCLLTNLNASITDKNHIGADFRIIAQPGTATQTGIHRGLSLFCEAKDSGTTCTISKLVGGSFSGRFLGDHGTTPITVTQFTVAEFEFNDLSSNPGGLVSTLRFIDVNPDAGNVHVSTCLGIDIGDLTGIGDGPTSVDAIKIVEQDDNGSALKGNLHFYGGEWNNGHIQLGGDAHIWFDGTTLFGKTTVPTGPTDGTDLLGGGSGGGDSTLEWLGV